ncbi:hypothetical protein [Azohydromonas lata]|uniref:3-keto-disaccharide hydrolase domain-containing protein n=1 Tax=Azohydromonas lata TaxID=45677 RepID=A0ABU5I941_9BURK|nr:hypothetical protein [Azohydromonas lata]MDZ5455622.1 hypothetical protein [Azohydromonas lata]
MDNPIELVRLPRRGTLAAPILTGLVALLLSSGTLAQADGFERDAVGASPPAGWHCGVTGQGQPRWAVTADPGAPSPSRVLLQDGAGTFPWCVKDSTALADGFVEAKFKPIAGREDQAGGVVWRWKDGDHYYVARANALENNVSLYYTERGTRRTPKYLNTPVARGAWHTLRVEFTGTHIAVPLDGEQRIEMDDRHITGPGAVGVWTKADSVTAFDDFAHGARP